MVHIEIHFNEIEYSEAPVYFESHQLFYMRENRIIPVLNKRALLVAMSSDLKVYIQQFSFTKAVHKKEFNQCSLSSAASLILEGKLKHVFYLMKNNVLKAVCDEDSFLHAVKEEYKFYIQ